MGCVFGREVSARPSSVEEERNDEVRAERAGRAESEVAEAPNGGNRKENEEEERSVKSRRRSGRPRPNPRLSNPPKHLHGEQVAAGWPSWLSAVAGEAINGWTPRRADTFEKLDKVSDLVLLNVRYSVESRFEERTSYFLINILTSYYFNFSLNTCVSFLILMNVGVI
jgi:cyclin-dependent kinase 12/13